MWLKLPKPILALAPMADMTDSPFCQVCREVAGNGFVIFREMVSSEAIVRGSEKTLSTCEFVEAERPVVLQLFGLDAETIRKAAKIVVDKFHPDGVDINMGCPVPKIAGKSDSGAALMKDPERAIKIIKALKKEEFGVQISVKTRLGWSREDEILDFASRLEEAGLDAISIHGRTRAQGYRGEANWKMIGQVKKLLSIPVIANGDVVDINSVQRCLEITGADGVMIGRGALGNPWIMKSEVKNLKYKVSESRNNESVLLREYLDVVLRHAELHVMHHGERGMVTFRKHLAWYFKANKIGTEIPNLKELRSRLVRVETMRELREVLEHAVHSHSIVPGGLLVIS